MAEQTLGQMVVKLSLDSSAYGSGLAAAKKATTGAMAEMRASMKIAAATGNQMSVLGEKQAGLAKQVEAQARQMRAAQEAYNKSFTNGNASLSTARYAKDFNNAAGKMAQFQAQMVRTAGQAAVLRTRTEGVTGAIYKMGTRVGTAGKALSDFGGKATMGLTVPIVAGFAAATKQAMEFQNRMVTIKNLLTTGGESSSQAISAVSNMEKQAVDLSNHYGVSVNKISQGYEDLVRRGYTGAQAVGAMKSELQGALASGDDFNDVVKVSAQTMESFGLRTNKAGQQIQSTSKMASITRSTVNQLAYAADATATDFASLGLSMQYVGSTAHTAGFGVAETSSALGILSNNGQTAQKAGTGLRKVIISLTTAVGNINGKKSVLKQLGISKDELVDSSGKLKNLDTIFSVLNQHTKDMSSVQKGVVFNKLFGTTGQTAGLILTQNANAMGKLTTKIQEASKTNYVGNLSQKNLASAQNQMRVFMETVKNLGMVLAQDVLPTLTPLMGKVASLADSFAHLDPSMRKAIVSFLAITAAVGPFSSGLGAIGTAFGKTSHGIIDMIGNVRKWHAEVSAASTATKIGRDAFAGLSDSAKAGAETLGDFTASGGKIIPMATASGAATKELGQATEQTAEKAATSSSLWSRLGGLFKTTGSAATETGTAIAGTGEGMTVATESGVGLTAALSAVGLGLLATGAAVAVGYGAWKLWGQNASESAARTKEWGTDVGASAGRAGDSFTKFKTQADLAMTGTSGTVKSNAKAISDAFDGMTRSAAKASQAQTDAASKLAGQLGGSAGAAVTQSSAGEEASRNKSLAAMRRYQQQANAITEESARSGKKLSADQIVQLGNLETSMAEAQVKTLGVSAKKQAAILKGELGQTGGATNKQLVNIEKSASDAVYKEADNNAKKMREINSATNVDAATKNKAREALEKTHNSTMTKLGEAYINAAKAQGKSQSTIMDEMTQEAGFSQKEAERSWNALSKSTAASAKSMLGSTKGLTGNAKKATQSWNSLVFDKKTGTIKTNLPEVLAKTAKTDSGWKKLKFALKNAKINSNAKQAIADALVSSSKWAGMTFKQKTAVLKSVGGKEVADTVQMFGLWNGMSLKDQKAVVSGNYEPLVQGLIKSNQWNGLLLKQKEALVRNKATVPLVDALFESGKWNKLSLKAKTAVVNAKGNKQLAQVIVQYGLWNSLPEKQKRLLVQDAGARKVLQQAGIYLESYNAMGVTPKLMTGDASGLMSAVTPAIAALNNYNGNNPHGKTLTGSAAGLMGAITPAVAALNGYNSNNPAPKTFMGNSSSVQGAAGSGKKSIISFNGTKPLPMTMVGHDKASRPAHSAKSAVDAFPTGRKVMDLITNIFTVHKKKARGTDNFEGGPVMVNDQGGSLFRELVIDPILGAFIPQGRDVLLNLQRNARVIPAARTDRMMGGIPQFANGLNVPADSPVIQMTNDIQNGAQSGVDTESTQLIVKLLTQIASQDPEGMIRALLGKIELSTDISISRAKVAKAMSSVTETQIAKALKRAGGGKSA